MQEILLIDIQKHLSSFKYDIFTDVDSIKAGEIWSNTIEENISSCDIFVVIVTHGALQSSHVEREVLQAQKEKKTIIPCFHRSVTNRVMKWELYKIQGVEFSVKQELARDLFDKIDIETINKPPTGSNGTKTGSGSSSHSIQWYLEKAKVFERLRQYQRALSNYDQAIKLDPDNFEALFPKVLLLYKMEKFDEALHTIEKAIDLQPENLDIWYHKGVILEKLERYEEALFALDTDLLIDDKDVKSWTDKANILIRLERYKEALEAFDEILKLDPDNTEAKQNKELGTKELKKQEFSSLINEIKSQIQKKDYSKVIDRCDKANEIYPDNYYPYLYKGNSFYELEQYEDAVEYYNKVLEIDSTNVESLNNKGLVLHKLGKYQDSVECYDKILAIYANDKEAIKNKKLALEQILIEKRQPKSPVDSKTIKYEFQKTWSTKLTPEYIAVDPKGYVYVTMNETKPTAYRKFWQEKEEYVYYSYVYKFDINGKFITKWGSYGTGDGEFKHLVGITIDSSSGNVYVVDSSNHRIQKFDSDGKFITTFGRYGAGDGELTYPKDISIDSSKGYVYICDSLNNRIQKFDSDGNFYSKLGKIWNWRWTIRPCLGYLC